MVVKSKKVRLLRDLRFGGKVAVREGGWDGTEVHLSKAVCV